MRIYKLINRTVHVLLITISFFGFEKECKSQELEVFIYTSKNVYNRLDTIYVTYWIENTTDKPIGFLEKSGLTVSKHCFEIYGADEELRRKDYGNIKKEDFITIEPNESIERTYPYMVFWLCRSAPPFEDWQLGVSYKVLRKENENYYFKVDEEGKKNKVFVDAWTGSIQSNEIEILIRKGN